MEIHLGRMLETSECVHHKDGDKLNGVIGNLKVMSTSDHTKLHIEEGTVGRQRSLDYDRISELRKEGLGYKRISKALGYPLASIKSACSKMERRG